MMMKVKLTIVLVLLFSSVFGQLNEIGGIPFKIEKTSETIRNELEPKFTSGIYYNRFFKKFHWTTEFVFGENEIEDYCTGCADAITGTGVYKEISIASGLGLRLHGKQHKGLTGNAKVLLYGARTSYAGYFGGGISPSYFYLDNRYYLLGVQLQYSLSYVFSTGISVGIDVAWKKSKTRPRVGDFISVSSYIPPTVSMRTLPSFRLGYQF
jgi:hypothetical protein